MKNMEREKFEESWKDAFDKAEISPSDRVWTNIELDLEKARGGELKKRLMFFQLLAAASVVFAMAIGGIGYFYAFNADPSSSEFIAADKTRESLDVQPSAPQQSPSKSEGLESTSETTNANDDSDSFHQSAAPQNDNTADREVRKADSTPGNKFEAVTKSSFLVARKEDEHEIAPPSQDGTNAQYPDLPSQIASRDLPPIYAPRKITLDIKDQEPQVDPVVAMLAKLERREREMQKDEKQKKDRNADSENLWTSIGFAAGSFNTVQASPAGPTPPTTSAFAMAANAAPIVKQEAKATGYSYTMGVNVGTRLSERWVLQGGLNYLTNSSEYTANNVVMESTGKFSEHRFRAASTNDLFKADEHDLNNKLVYTAPYSVNNSMRYLSIPLQAGYLLVNKTFGLQLNAGVATDLFLQNTVEGESDQLAKTSQPAGSDSPYRAVNLSGLLGTELSYRFGPHYRVSLNPGIRYPFNTIYKSELGVQSTPLTFDVGLRFRYIFH